MQPPQLIELRAVASELGDDLDQALAQLTALYTALDQRLAKTTASLELPCGPGCSDCCKQGVFLTPLEFFAIWDFAQNRLPKKQLGQIVESSLNIHREQQDKTHADPFACPLLADDGTCRVYPVRELSSRLFGCTFNENSGVYGCQMVGEKLADKTLTLVQARPVFQQLQQLPLTFMSQQIPYYVALFY